jgi:hypothetical protein
MKEKVEWKKVSDLMNDPNLPITDKRKAEVAEGHNFPFQTGQTISTIGGDWYRGDHINFWPSKANLKEEDAVYEFFLKGFLPAEPFIKKTDFITTFGSCFAAHIRSFFYEKGYPIHNPKSHWLPIIHVGEGLNTTFALRQQFAWAWENEHIDNELWVDADKTHFTITEEGRLETKEIFDKTDVFILTVGLSEIWYNKQTGGVFWRGVPRSKYDPDIHGFRVSTVDENFANLNYIYKLIRRHRPEAKIIITLSPVPLIATFRDIPCTSASMVSKAILRVAVDQLYQDHKDDPLFFYWPSYELVKEYNNSFQDDNRHVGMDILATVLGVFDKYYLVKEK